MNITFEEFKKSKFAKELVDPNYYYNSLENYYKNIIYFKEYNNRVNIISYDEDGYTVIKRFFIIKNNKFLLHRENGPALEKGKYTKTWLVNGKLHREDGPAYIYYKNKNPINGNNINSNNIFKYYLEHREYKKEEFLYLTKYKEKYKYSL